MDQDIKRGLVLYCIVLYYIILYYVILYYIILYYIILYYIISHHTWTDSAFHSDLLKILLEK